MRSELSLGGLPSRRASDVQPRSVALQAVEALVTHPRVREAESAVREAATELRWAEALRRRWREARAEASIRAAIASAAVDGASVSPQVLREAVAQRAVAQAVSEDPAFDVAAGHWRAQARVVSWMDDLVGHGRAQLPPVPARLASLHRDIAGPLAARGQVSMAEVGALRVLDAGEVQRWTMLVELIEASEGSALVRSALVHGELATLQPFVLGSDAVGRAVVREIVTRSALEPTGTAVCDLLAAREPGAYQGAVEAYASGSDEGVIGWIEWNAQALLVGIDEAHRLARAVQAGMTGA